MSSMTQSTMTKGAVGHACYDDTAASFGRAGGDRTQDPGGYCDLDSAGLGDAATELATLGSVVHAELLQILAELAHRDQVPGGFGDLVEFCTQRFGVLRRTAREWVDVAVALRGLPAISALYASGEISWDKVRHAARFATAGTDAVVADELSRFTAQQVAQLAAETQRRSGADDQAAHDCRSLRMRNDHRRGGVRITGWLPFADAEALRHDLAERARQIGPDPSPASGPPSTSAWPTPWPCSAPPASPLTATSTGRSPPSTSTTTSSSPTPTTPLPPRARGSPSPAG
jgi:hypothetical protein